MSANEIAFLMGRYGGPWLVAGYVAMIVAFVAWMAWDARE